MSIEILYLELKLKKSRSEKKVTEEQLSIFFKEAKPKLTMLVKIIISTRLRVSELCQINHYKLEENETSFSQEITSNNIDDKIIIPKTVYEKLINLWPIDKATGALFPQKPNTLTCQLNRELKKYMGQPVSVEYLRNTAPNLLLPVTERVTSEDIIDNLVGLETPL